MERTNQTLRIPSMVNEIRHVQDFILRKVTEAGFDSDCCFAIRLALEESLINAVRHGNCLDPKRSVLVKYDINNNCARITVKDEGRGFDPAKVPDPTTKENLSKPRGRGIMLMRAYMDEVTYSDCGTEVTLVKKNK